MVGSVVVSLTNTVQSNHNNSLTFWQIDLAPFSIQPNPPVTQWIQPLNSKLAPILVKQDDVLLEITKPVLWGVTTRIKGAIPWLTLSYKLISYPRGLTRIWWTINPRMTHFGVSWKRNLLVSSLGWKRLPRGDRLINGLKPSQSGGNPSWNI